MRRPAMKVRCGAAGAAHGWETDPGQLDITVSV